MRPGRGNFWVGFGQGLALALVGAMLVGYFLWLCLEMGSHTHLGLDMLVGTFGAVGAGLAAGALALAIRSVQRRRHPPEPGPGPGARAGTGARGSGRAGTDARAGNRPKAPAPRPARRSAQQRMV